MTIIIQYDDRQELLRIRFVQSITQVGEHDIETKTFGNDPVKHRNVDSVEIVTLED